MLRRTYRKMPRDFEQVESKFGRTPLEAYSLLGTYSLRIGSRSKADIEAAAKELVELASDYSKFFQDHPEKIHVFPMAGTIFQFEFARGVRDALFLAGELKKKPEVKSIVPVKNDSFHTYTIDRPTMAEQGRKLGLRNKKIVVHDYFNIGSTDSSISRAAGNKNNTSTKHWLAEYQVFRGGEVPVSANTQNSKYVDTRVVKKSKIKGKPAITLRSNSGISEKELSFVKRACYASGVAAAREMMRSKK